MSAKNGFCIFCILLMPIRCWCQIDTSVQKSACATFSYQTSISGTFSAQHNWYNDENDYKSITFLFNGIVTYKKLSVKFKQHYSLRTNLGYLKILDSIWIKNNDNWRINCVLIENQNKWLTHTYSIAARSQFLNTYRYVYNTDKDETVKTKTAAFFNPAIITLAYGVSYSFWEDNFINFNFAAVSFKTQPRFGNYRKSKDYELAKTKAMYMYADYGMNIQTNINKAINPFTQWENYSSFFVNGINKQQVNLDFSNAITFKFLKFVQFRIATHILYDALFSTKLQYQNEFTLGFVFAGQKKAVNHL